MNPLRRAGDLVTELRRLPADLHVDVGGTLIEAEPAPVRRPVTHPACGSGQVW